MEHTALSPRKSPSRSLSESAVTPSRSPPPRSNSARSVSSRDSFNDDRLDLKGGTALVALGHPRQLDLKFKRGQTSNHLPIEGPTLVPLPLLSVGDEAPLSVACGDAHAIILTSAGRVFVWGSGPACDVTSTNLGPSAPRRAATGLAGSPPRSPGARPAPLARAATGLGHAGGKQVQGLPACSAVASGAEHALALGNDGSLWAWGAGAWGQLGVGDAPHVAQAPRAVAALRGEPVGSVCGGGAHSLAVLSTGELYAWGAANHHQLGIPEAAEEKPPQLNAPRCVYLDQLVVHAAAGATMSACVTEGGAVYTWGEGLHGELGHGAATTSLPSPVAVARLWGLRVASVAVGSHHCVARLRNGQLMAWRRGERSTGSSRRTPRRTGWAARRRSRGRRWRRGCGGTRSSARRRSPRAIASS